MRIAWLLLAGLIVASCATAPIETRTAYVNGWVFDGAAFHRRDLIVAGERFVSGEARRGDVQIDLAGGYVIPPLCEAHNHNLGAAAGNEEAIAAYLRDGVFYVGILSNLPALTAPNRALYNRADSVDVVFGNGGLTATGGHPIPLRHFLLERGAYPGFTRESLADHSYFVIDNGDDLDRRWPLITSFAPDFIKIFLLFSEEYAARRDDAQFEGQRGLDPALVPAIVARAHAEGLRVFAHVESGHDFHVAIASGVDVIAHLPGNQFPTRIDPADARRAAQRDVPVITSVSLVERASRRPRYAALRAAQADNLRVLREAGVRIVIGSDEPGDTSVREAASLRALNVLNNAELLNAWTRDCARTLFPERRLGVLAPGYEASFLVLANDPLADLTATGVIRRRVKQGASLD